MKKVHFGYGIVLVLFAIIALTGCPPTVTQEEKSSNAYLNSITVLGSDGTNTFDTRLSPFFNRDTMTYQVGIRNDAASATVTVNPDSTTLKSLTINGQDALSSKSAVVTTTNDHTLVTVVLVSESETTTKTYTIDLVKAAGATVPLTLTTVDSVNGTLVSTVDYEILKDSDRSSLATGATNASGVATINLTPNQYVYIETTKTDYAGNTIQKFWIDALEANSAIAINKKLGMITKSAGSTVCTGVYYTQNADYSALTAIDMTNPAYQLSITGATYLVFEMYSQNSIEPTAWSGFGSKIGIDVLPSAFEGLVPSKVLENVKDTSKAGYSYRTRVAFTLNSKEIVSGYHIFHLTAYDIANNRLHMAIPIKISSNLVTEYTTTEPAFTTGNFYGSAANLRTYPFSRDYFGTNPGSGIDALNPYLGSNVSYASSLKFGFFTSDPTVVGSTAKAVRIRGFDVYRSTDNATWTKIASKNYGALSSGSGGYHTYVDTDSSLVMGTTYYYKFTVFADAVQSKASGTVFAQLMAAYQSALASPANRTGFAFTPPSTGIPNFTFTVSNTTLWDSAVSDYFYFLLTIRDKVGGYKYVGMYRYNFSLSRFEAKLQGGTFYAISDAQIGLAADDIAYSAGTITIKPAVLLTNKTDVLKLGLVLAKGATYEWDIFGDLDDSGWYPAFFAKEFKDGTTVVGTARTYGGALGIGDNAVNGSFEFYAN